MEIKPLTPASGESTRIVDATVNQVESECYLVSWQEADKTSVVQIIDLKQGLCLANIKSKDNPQLHKTGTVSLGWQ